MAVLVDFEIEGSLGVVGLLHGDREIRHRPGLRVELGKELLAEMRVPDHAVGIDDDVVRLNLLPREIVFGDDDVASRVRLGRGEVFQLEAMRRLAAEIDAGEIFREPLCDGWVYGRPPVLAD